MIIDNLEFIPMRIETTNKDFLIYLICEYEFPIGEIVLGFNVFKRRREREITETVEKERVG